jgi:hypothetical protein
VDIEDIAVQLKGALRRIPQGRREEFLRLLQLPNDEQAAAIGRLYEMEIAPDTIELLIDLFDDPSMRRFLITELRVAGVPPRDQ